jgi:hypothetical protein
VFTNLLQLLPGQLPAVKIAVRNNRRKRAVSATVWYRPASPTAEETARVKRHVASPSESFRDKNILARPTVSTRILDSCATLLYALIRRANCDRGVVDNLRVLGFGTSGLTFQVVHMTQPNGHVFSLKAEQPRLEPQNVRQFSEFLIVLIHILQSTVSGLEGMGAAGAARAWVDASDGPMGNV